jgi:hypothetical protein
VVEPGEDFGVVSAATADFPIWTNPACQDLPSISPHPILFPFTVKLCSSLSIQTRQSTHGATVRCRPLADKPG